MCISIELGPVEVNAATISRKELHRKETQTDGKEINVAP